MRLQRAFEKIMVKNYLNLGKDNPIGSRNWANLKQDKLKDIHAKTHNGKTSENYRKWKISLKQSEKQFKKCTDFWY